ncbi:hypothetical protein NDU88_001407 [Pleurodeles waltl]|uniref:Uncharacterized protein n=1 Tax=Pleurodeles waltl TaxID=8319 RepID=A0AAV7W1E4_PLEWA|nr:hypothetical protein NDU88_001407 [Pleurodeles waltl]
MPGRVRSQHFRHYPLPGQRPVTKGESAMGARVGEGAGWISGRGGEERIEKQREERGEEQRERSGERSEGRSGERSAERSRERSK